MDRIWAPWRHAYVTQGVREPGCVLCKALEHAEAEGSLVVHVGVAAFVVMNLFPYNAGHVMICPKRHVATLGDLDDAELAELMVLARRLEAVVGEAYSPDGINLGMNLGSAAGAGLADHLHLHLVPRWNGDTNFMTVAAGTRVIPEDPAEACQRLRPLFSE